MKILLVKAVVSMVVILIATGVARRFPSLAGLIGTMPLTGALILAWIYLENNGDQTVMRNYATGALFGIAPSILFFLIAFIGFSKGFPLKVVFSASMAAWLIGASVHQYFLR